MKKGTVSFLRCPVCMNDLKLEVGSGSGQKLKMMAEHTSGKAIGLDLSSGVEYAYENNKELENIGVVQANLFTPPFKRNVSILL